MRLLPEVLHTADADLMNWRISPSLTVSGTISLKTWMIRYNPKVWNVHPVTVRGIPFTVELF